MIESADAATGIAGVIEILSRSGQVQQRIPYRGERLRVGRAYDNDIIVGDPYVFQHHLSLERRDGRFLIRDEGSLNGSYQGRERARFDEIELRDETRVHFGHSQLRYRRAGGRVAPAWRDISRHGILALFDKPLALLAAVLFALVSVSLDNLLESRSEPGAGELASQLLYPVMGILLWSGFWSLINRVVSHRANFHVHLAIGCAGIAGLFALDQSISLLGFAWGWDRAVPGLLLLSRIGVLALAVYAHLRYATHGKPVLQAVVAGVAGLLLFGTPAVGDYLDGSEFDTVPRLNPLLKPPVFRVRQGVSVERFFEESAYLKKRLEED